MNCTTSIHVSFFDVVFIIRVVGDLAISKNRQKIVAPKKRSKLDSMHFDSEYTYVASSSSVVKQGGGRECSEGKFRLRQPTSRLVFERILFSLAFLAPEV